jgi:hypothetical protein
MKFSRIELEMIVQAKTRSRYYPGKNLYLVRHPEQDYKVSTSLVFANTPEEASKAAQEFSKSEILEVIDVT